MVGSIIIFVFILIIAVVIYFEYKNEKKYKKSKKSQVPSRKKEVETSVETTTIKKTIPPVEKIAVPEAPKEEIVQKTTVQKEDIKPEPVSVETLDLPKANYTKFDHSRLIDMGLSEDEAKEYAQELIPQVEAQIPLIEEALSNSDFQSMERLTHSIKGSATTVGTGGISDLLTEYNTYLKSGTEITIAEVYLEHLKHYSKELKNQYN